MHIPLTCHLLLIMNKVHSFPMRDESYESMLKMFPACLRIAMHTLERALWKVLGGVAAPWDEHYEVWRAIHTPACCQKPLLIHRPRSTRDVSRALRSQKGKVVKLNDLMNVRFAQHANLEVSVRSGGHSYTCTSIKVRATLLSTFTLLSLSSDSLSPA